MDQYVISLLYYNSFPYYFKTLLIVGIYFLNSYVFKFLHSYVFLQKLSTFNVDTPMVLIVIVL